MKIGVVWAVAILLIGAMGAERFSTAQVETGQLAGAVTDPSGAVIPGASVTVTNLGTNAERTETTSSNGAYTMTGLAPATYQVRIQAAGFQPYTAKVEITVGGHVTLDGKLSVSSNTTQVEVVGEGGSQVNTQTQELSQVVNQEQVSQLPSLSRNPYDFVALSGNISSGDSSSSGDSRSNNTYQNGPTTTRGVGFSINGQRTSGTEVLLDGVENISVFADSIGVYVPVDAVQEFRVTTSNFEAQYGRASGGVVNVSTKAGSNSFHGHGSLIDWLLTRRIPRPTTRSILPFSLRAVPDHFPRQRASSREISLVLRLEARC